MTQDPRGPGSILGILKTALVIFELSQLRGSWVYFENFENYFCTFRVVSGGGWLILLNFENWAYVPPYVVLRIPL